AHPVLIPFAVRLVWGLFAGDAKLQATFRALEDRTLTTADDQLFALSDAPDLRIGMVHPLELSAEERHSWSVHLADYGIQSPFLQLERPVFAVSQEEREGTTSSRFCGIELNAMTFHGRAERLGWQRGAVFGAGGILWYRKSFPEGGIDAVVAV